MLIYKDLQLPLSNPFNLRFLNIFKKLFKSGDTFK